MLLKSRHSTPLCVAAFGGNFQAVVATRKGRQQGQHLAPLGVTRFLSLVNEGFIQNNLLYRVRPGLLVQPLALARHWLKYVIL